MSLVRESFGLRCIQIRVANGLVLLGLAGWLSQSIEANRDIPSQTLSFEPHFRPIPLKMLTQRRPWRFSGSGAGNGCWVATRLTGGCRCVMDHLSRFHIVQPISDGLYSGNQGFGLNHGGVEHDQSGVHFIVLVKLDVCASDTREIIQLFSDL